MGERAAAAPLMRDLSLLDAFRACGPILGLPEVDEARESAAARLLTELRGLVWRLEGFNPEIRDEAVQVVLVRLFKAGPRGTRHGDPESEAAVRGYLFTALRNAARDLRPRRFFDEIDATVEAQAPNPVRRPDQELETLDQASSAQSRLAEVAARFQEVVQATAAALGDRVGARFLATMEELAAIADGRQSFDGLVEHEMRATGGTAVTVKNRFYKRYSRVLERLGETIDQQERAGSLAPPDRQALLAALDRVRLRQDGGR
jgi:hypothetical protein